MACYFVRWYDPTRTAPLIRDFSGRAKAEAFRADLCYLSDPPRPYADPNRPSRAKLKPARQQVTWTR